MKIETRVHLQVQLLLIIVVGALQLSLYKHHQEEALISEMRSAQLISDGIINGLNMMMENKTISDPVARARFIKKSSASNNIVNLQVLRGEPVTKQFGPGLPQEQPDDALDTQALKDGQRHSFHYKDGDLNRLRIIIPFIAHEEYLGSKCLNCHNVPEGTINGAMDLTLDTTQEVNALNTYALRNLLTFLFIQALLFVAIRLILRRYVTQPIDKIRDILTRIETTGNYDLRVNTKLSGEIGQMAFAINNMLSTLQHILLDINTKMIAIAKGDFSQHENVPARGDLEKLEYGVNNAVIKLEQSNLKFTALFNATADSVILFDEIHIIDCNPATLTLFGFSTKAECLASTLFKISPSKQPCGNTSYKLAERYFAQSLKNDNVRFEWLHERVDNGFNFPAEILLSSILLNGRQLIQATIHDITERKNQIIQLEKAAHYDSLTGIPNRKLFTDRLSQAIALSKRENKVLGVLYIDLDNFKPINDNYGHATGDEVLVEVAHRISTTLRTEDSVARLGGDEFAVLLVGMATIEQCSTAIERILDTLSMGIKLDSGRFLVTCSIGAALYPMDSNDPDMLMRFADQAMYQAKLSGKNQYCLHDAQKDKLMHSRQTSIDNVHAALKNNELELFYQPKIDMISGNPIGAEALIRWRHPTRGLVSPIDFIPLIDNTELEIPVGEWVIAEAIKQIETWKTAGLSLEISINISANHLQSEGFVASLKERLPVSGLLAHGQLQIEILETTALDDITKVSEIITSCKDIGISFALDDFGTGYSSLTYLSHLPVDVIKIDQTFVYDMLKVKGDHAIVQGVIVLSQAFERKVVAEGVESNAQRLELLNMGCTVGQGYEFAHPMPADEFFDWVSKKLAAKEDPLVIE